MLQAQNQLKAIYKDNADTIIGNMDSRIFLKGSEPTTRKELNAALGSETRTASNRELKSLVEAYKGKNRDSVLDDLAGRKSDAGHRSAPPHGTKRREDVPFRRFPYPPDGRPCAA